MKVDNYVPGRCRGVKLHLIFNEVHGEATVLLHSVEYLQGQPISRVLSAEYRVPAQVPATVEGIWEALAEVVLNRTLPLSGD
jgi:hypothetical protein